MELMTEDQSVRKGMEHLVTVVQELSLARDMNTVTGIVRTAARKLTGADGATFVLRDNGKCYYADEDAISPLWKGSRFPMSSCVSGWVMFNKKPVAIEDIYLDSRVPHDAYRPTFVKSMAMVPIRTIDPIGAIGNYWATHHQPTEGEMELLQSLADITAVTIENVNVYAELEQRVRDRTAELQAANKALEAFSYSVSHDLRAPLRSISGYTHALIEQLGARLTEDEIAISGRIVNGVSQMENLIEALLTFSRMTKHELIREKVATREMVDKICETHLEDAGSRLEFKIGNLKDVMADKTLIAQVWINLISNAVKYSSKKEKAVIEIQCEENERETIFSVKDNGVGFRMEYANKLFGVFQRLHSPRDFEGTGIGLSLVERIVSRHGGKVWAQAEPDEGAEFCFSIPQ